MQGIIYVIDSNDHERIDEARDELHLLLQEDELQGLPLLVLANKQDLGGVMTVPFISEALRLTSLIDRNWYIHATSVLTGEGLIISMNWISNAIK